MSESRLNFGIRMEQKWQSAERIKSHVPEHFVPWLYDLQSMTQAMRRVATQLTVQIVGQSWQFPTISEAHYLNINPAHYALIRDVYLIDDGVIWAYGRTVIPHTLFKGKYQYLVRELNEQPIGDLLYEEQDAIRLNLEVTRLSPSQPLFQKAIQGYKSKVTELWARRAQFHLFDSRLSVCEVIFPEITTYVEAKV